MWERTLAPSFSAISIERSLEPVSTMTISSTTPSSEATHSARLCSSSRTISAAVRSGESLIGAPDPAASRSADSDECGDLEAGLVGADRDREVVRARVPATGVERQRVEAALVRVPELELLRQAHVGTRVGLDLPQPHREAVGADVVVGVRVVDLQPDPEDVAGE